MHAPARRACRRNEVAGTPHAAAAPLTDERVTLGGVADSVGTSRWLAVAPVGVALLLWFVALPRIDLSRIDDYGLLPAFPPEFFAALAVLTLGFVLLLRVREPAESVLALHVAALIVILHATPAIEYGTLRYSWAWKHVGIVDYIQRHGSVDPNIQFLTAYHNWPGFFALSAFFTEIGGFDSALDYASWAPVFFNLLFIAALVVLFRALVSDLRRIWLGIWFFCLGNWIGQDYFSPQAFAYFLFLVVVASCVLWFRLAEVPTTAAVRRFLPSDRGSNLFVRALGHADPDVRPLRDVGPRERIGIVALVVLLVITVASSHQLTPFMLMLGLTGLVVFQRLRLRALPVLVAAVSLGWVVLFSVGFLRGNLYWVVDSLGALTTNAGSTLINLADASEGQRVVAEIGRFLTLGVWALGTVGFVFLLVRRRSFDLTVGVLAVAPFGMLGATSYGGEILFRVYFFALPFFALLAAGIFFPTRSTERWWSTLARGLVMVLLLVGFLFAYYGKEAQNYFSKEEVRASEYLYKTAAPGSVLIAGVNNYPWAFTHYENFKYVALADLLPKDRRHAIADPAGTIGEIADHLDAPCAYVLITDSQRAAVDMTGVMPAGSLNVILRSLLASPRYRVMWSNPRGFLFGIPVGASAAECHLPR